jgi:hypothetical protein
MIGLIADLNIFFLANIYPTHEFFSLKKNKNKNLRKLQPFPLGCVHIPTEKIQNSFVSCRYFFFLPFIDKFRKKNCCCTAFDVV